MDLLGGSGVVIIGIISKVTIVITHITGLITIHITTHDPPSVVRLSGGFTGQGCRALINSRAGLRELPLLSKSGWAKRLCGCLCARF